MSQRQPVTVRILDREFKLTCEPEERRQLLDAADYLDSEMRKIRDGAGVVGMEKVAVLAALNISNELIMLKHREEAFGTEVGKRLAKLRARLDEAMPDAEQSP